MLRDITSFRPDPCKYARSRPMSINISRQCCGRHTTMTALLCLVDVRITDLGRPCLPAVPLRALLAYLHLVALAKRPCRRSVPECVTGSS
jgi:hypothetical protein